MLQRKVQEPGQPDDEERPAARTEEAVIRAGAERERGRGEDRRARGPTALHERTEEDAHRRREEQHEDHRPEDLGTHRQHQLRTDEGAEESERKSPPGTAKRNEARAGEAHQRRPGAEHRLPLVGRQCKVGWQPRCE